MTTPRVAALFPLHYGAEYLRQAVQSVAPHVNRIVALYTPRPSYGHATAEACPETEEQLRACFDGFPVEWHRGEFGSEGEHRNAGYALCGGASLIVQCDADEVWEGEDLLRCIRAAQFSPAGQFQITQFVHFWRSFDWACRDVWAPTRLIKPGMHGKQAFKGRVYHMGYCQSEMITRYKWLIHGHLNELRPGWFENIFLDPTRKHDLHPVVKDWWTAEKFDKQTLPDCLKSHPNFELDLVK